MEVSWNSLNLICNKAISWYKRKQVVISVYLDDEGMRALVYTGEDTGGVELTYRYNFVNVGSEEYDNYTGAASEEPWYFTEENLQTAIEEWIQKLRVEGYEMDKLLWLFALGGCAYKESLELPVLTQVELEEALAWEVPQRIPWEDGSFFYRYMLKQGQNKNEGKDLAPVQDVCVYAIPKQCVATVTKVCESLHLTLAKLIAAEALDDMEQPVDMEEIEFYESFYTEAQLQALQQEFAQPLLLAVLFVKNKIAWNFLPNQEQIQAVLHQTRRLCQWLSIFIFFLSLCLGCGCLFWRGHLEQQASAQQEKYAQLSLWEARREELQSLQGENQRLAGKLKSLGENKISWSKYLWGLGRVMPRGCWLTKVEAQEGKNADKKKGQLLVLTGKAANLELVGQLVQNLQKQEGYVKVELEDADLKSNNKKSRGFLDFRIRAEVKTQSSDQEKGSAKHA